MLPEIAARGRPDCERYPERPRWRKVGERGKGEEHKAKKEQTARNMERQAARIMEAKKRFAKRIFFPDIA